MQYIKTVKLPQPVNEVFKFCTNAHNICLMLPDYISVRILQGKADMKRGDILKLKIKISGITFLWESMITSFEENVYFSDKMICGPFKKWEHKHMFQSTPDGKTIMTDIIDYEIPLGPIGLLADKIFVRYMIDNIFVIRHNFDISADDNHS